jgi:hypothetical protein
MLDDGSCEPKHGALHVTGQDELDGVILYVCWLMISVTYSECVFVAVGIQRAMHKRSIVIRVLSSSTLFFHVISSTARCPGKKSY